jgi:hypothetical protein
MLRDADFQVMAFSAYAKLTPRDVAACSQRYPSPAQFRDNPAERLAFEQYVAMCCNNDDTFLKPLLDSIKQHNDRVQRYHGILESMHAIPYQQNLPTDVRRVKKEPKEEGPENHHRLILNPRPPVRAGESVRHGQKGAPKAYTQPALAECWAAAAPPTTSSMASAASPGTISSAILCEQPSQEIWDGVSAAAAT